MIRLFTFLLLAILSFPGWGAILYTNANETPLSNTPSDKTDSAYINTLKDDCTRQDPNGYVDSPTIHVRRVTSPRRAGDYGLVQILQKGCDYRASNDGGLLQKPRVGMQILASTVDAHSITADKRERWVSGSIYFPTDFAFENSSIPLDNLFQVFKLGNRNQGASAFFIELVQDDLKLTARNTHPQGLQSTPNTYTISNIVRGQWYDFTLHFKLQEPGGSGGFFRWYINYPGYATPNVAVMTEATAGTTVNTETGAGQHNFQWNFYKYAGYCTSAYHSTPAQCPYGPPTYPVATSTSTVWTGQRKIYFDEFRVGDSSSSLAEVAPHWASSPPTSGPEIIGMNVGSPIEPNDDPVYFTVSGGAVDGCIQVDITDIANTKVTMPKCNSNATGGRFTADALTTLVTGPITVDLLYDTPLFDTATMANPMVGWNVTNTTTAAAYTNGSADADYGYTGVKLTNSGTAGVIYPSTGDRVTIANGATATARFVYAPDTDTQVKLQVASSAGTVEYSGTPGSLTRTLETTGTNWSKTEWYSNGFWFADVTFTSNNSVSSGTWRPQIGPKTAGPNKSIIVWDAKLWENRTPTTISYETTLVKADTTAPELVDCQLAAIETTPTYNLGCSRSETGGTFYSVISTSATAPSLAQVKAGQDHTGAAALWAGSQPATSGTFTTTALNPYVQKCAYFAQTDAASNDSAVVAAEACIAAETPVVKKIKFLDSATRLRTRNGATFGGELDFFTLHPTDPRLPGPKTDLVYIDNPSITAGVIDFGESATQCGTCTGSINALPAGQYWYSTRSTDGTVKAINIINIIAE